MSDTLTRRDVETAIDCLDRAVHAGTSDTEAIAAIRAWRRKTGKRLVREVCEGHFAQATPRRVHTDNYQRDRKLMAENLTLKHEVDSWRREAVKWHEEYQRVFGFLTPKETKSLYDKIARRQEKAGQAPDQAAAPRSLRRRVNRDREALFAAAWCIAFLVLFAAAKWVLFLIQHPTHPGR